MAREYILKSATPTPDFEAAETLDFASHLNEQQLAVVTSPPGQSLVIAGAGSGKTRTLTYRVAYLLQNAISPQNILLLTFTNKAAREMLERVELLLPGRTAGLWGGTFHSVCNRILRRHPEKVGLERNYTILDSEDQRSLMAKILKESGIGDEVAAQTNRKFPKPPVILSLLSLAANTQRTVAEVVETEFNADPRIIGAMEKLGKLYKDRKLEGNAADFDDLLLLTLQLFHAQPDILSQYQYQFQFILVDEYQDTNSVQGELVDLLAGRHGNIMVVGDDAQSIYSWRGADFRYILEFPKRHPKARTYRIETNYRSVPEVLRFANASIRANEEQFEKTLRPTRDACGMRPALVPLSSPQQQAMFVAQRIQELVDGGIPYSEIAVLYRAHFQSMEVQMQLTQDGIPFVITSGLKFFEQAHIKDFSAFLKFVANPRDEAAFDRLVKLLPGIGDTTSSKLWRQWVQSEPARSGAPPVSFSNILIPMKVPAKARTDWDQLAYTLDEMVTPEGKLRPPAAMMKSALEAIYEEYLEATFDNAEQRRQDLEQFMRFGDRFSDVQDFLSELSLLSGPEQTDSNPALSERDSVCLSSIHQAKGLEWRVVFVIWLTEAMFPNPRAVEEGGIPALEEERRLFYVAVTRARDQLYLTYPRVWQKAYDGDAWQTPSLFLSEVPKETTEEWRIGI